MKQTEYDALKELIDSGDLKLLDNGNTLYYNEDRITYHELKELLAGYINSEKDLKKS